MSIAMGASESLGDQLRALTANTASYMTYDTHLVRIHQPETPASGVETLDPLGVSLSPYQEYLEPVIFGEVARTITQNQPPVVVDCIARLVGSNVVYLDEARQIFRPKAPLIIS